MQADVPIVLVAAYTIWASRRRADGVAPPRGVSRYTQGSGAGRAAARRRDGDSGGGAAAGDEGPPFLRYSWS
jgi:hypothetical protein